MNKEEFFSKIISVDSNSTYEILKARGFFIFRVNGNYFLSDNASKEDASYLKTLLSKYNLGNISFEKATYDDKSKNSIAKLNFSPDVELNDLVSAFEDIAHISAETANVRIKWSYFYNKIFGNKVPITLLEPYISRYIKSISACGILTFYSCDGNHRGKNEIKIGCNEHFDLWHNWIYRNLVPIEFQSEHFFGSVIRFTPATQFEEYYKLNKAAEWLYENRLLIRRLKSELRQVVKEKINIKKSTNEKNEEVFLYALKILEERL